MDTQRLQIFGITKDAYARHQREICDILTETSTSSCKYWSDDQTFSLSMDPVIVVSTTSGLSVSVKTNIGDIAFTLKADDYDYALIKHKAS